MKEEKRGDERGEKRHVKMKEKVKDKRREDREKRRERTRREKKQDKMKGRMKEKMKRREKKEKMIFSLSRNVLKDFAVGEDPELFFRRCSGGGFTDDYGPNCTVESWSPVSYSSGHVVGMRTSRKRFMRRSTSSRLKRARSGTPRTTEGPLVPSEPRGCSDGNCRRSLRLASGGDETVSSPGVEPGKAAGSSDVGPFFSFCVF